MAAATTITNNSVVRDPAALLRDEEQDETERGKDELRRHPERELDHDNGARRGARDAAPHKEADPGDFTADVQRGQRPTNCLSDEGHPGEVGDPDFGGRGRSERQAPAVEHATDVDREEQEEAPTGGPEEIRDLGDAAPDDEREGERNTRRRGSRRQGGARLPLLRRRRLGTSGGAACCADVNARSCGGSYAWRYGCGRSEKADRSGHQ